MNLAITTRINPPLPLARLRARDQLTELRANDLRFSVDETAEFLIQVMGLSLSAEEVVALESRTEGWIAGLQIAAISMHGRDDIQSFFRAFSGGHRHFLGYRAEEVLNHQTEDTLNFLLQTSILDRLCAPLCDAVTGKSNGHEILQSLEHANLFVTALDDEARWYRYHHLFAEVLQARLRKTHIVILSELHCQASVWLEQNGFLAEAVSHALASQDLERAVRLIESIGIVQFSQPIIQFSLKAWLAALPEHLKDNRPRLLLVQAWQLFAQLEMTAASLCVDEAEQALQKAQSDLDEQEVRNLRGAIAAMRAFSYVYTPTPDLEKVLAWAEAALSGLNSNEFSFLGLTAGAMGMAHLKLGNVAQALQRFSEAATAGRWLWASGATAASCSKFCMSRCRTWR